jgi:hypothetical protein
MVRSTLHPRMRAAFIQVASRSSQVKNPIAPVTPYTIAGATAEWLQHAPAS